jgi:anti-sigma regulatory factor (Ser/Thr protein kinase)
MDEPLYLRIAADLKNLAPTRRFVEDAAASWNGDPEAIAEMVLAVNEAVTNTIVHGYQGQPGIIEVEVGYDKDALVVCLRDQAPKLDPTSAPAPDVTLSLGQRPFGGMGIYMMRQLTDELIYRTTSDGRNELILVKKGVQRF